MGVVISAMKLSLCCVSRSIGVFDRGIGLFAEGFHLRAQARADECVEGVVGQALKAFPWFPEGEGHVTRGTAIAAHVVLAFVVDEYREGDVRLQVLDQCVLDGEVESGAVLGDELVVFAQVFDCHAKGNRDLSRKKARSAMSRNSKILTSAGAPEVEVRGRG